ncbi:MAG: NYN domain-containing protein [Candidatus Saccharibacteria bacterium]
MKVFIDGENFRHRLAGVLVQEGLLGDYDQPFEFDVPALLVMALAETPQQISYYTSRVKQPHFDVPPEMIDRIDGIRERSRRWLASLSNQGIVVIKAGYLKVRESSKCLHCGQKNLILQEKGVDVRLATDVVLAAAVDHLHQLAVLSSDADMIPALESARASGATVTYLCFAEEINGAIASVSSQTLTYSRRNIVDIFKGDQS